MNKLLEMGRDIRRCIEDEKQPRPPGKRPGLMQKARLKGAITLLAVSRRV